MLFFAFRPKTAIFVGFIYKAFGVTPIEIHFSFFAPKGQNATFINMYGLN